MMQLADGSRDSRLAPTIAEGKRARYLPYHLPRPQMQFVLFRLTLFMHVALIVELEVPTAPSFSYLSPDYSHSFNNSSTSTIHDSPIQA